MLGFDRLKHKRIIFGLLAGTMLALLFAADMGAPPASPSPIVSILAGNSAFASSPFIAGDEFSPANPDRDYVDRKGAPSGNAPASLTLQNGLFSNSAYRAVRSGSSARSLTGNRRQVCQLLDMPPPSAISS